MCIFTCAVRGGGGGGMHVCMQLYTVCVWATLSEFGHFSADIGTGCFFTFSKLAENVPLAGLSALAL